MTLLTQVPRIAFVLVLASLSGPALAGKAFKVCVLAAAALFGGIQAASDQYKTDHSTSAIEVIRKDTQGRPDLAVALAREVIATEGCHIVGAMSEREAHAVAEFVGKSDKPALYVETVARTSLLESSWMFRLSSPDSQEAQGAARYLAEQKKASVAVLSDPSSQPLREAFGNAAATAIPGWRGFIDSTVLPDGDVAQAKVQEEIARLAAKDPQAILIAIRTEGRRQLTNALSTLPPAIRSKTVVLGHYGSPPLVARIQAAGDTYPIGIIAGTPDTPTWDNGCTGSGCNDTQPPHAKWVKNMAERTKFKAYSDYPPYAIQIYVSLQFLDEAATRAGRADAPSIAKALGGLSLRSSPLGPISISEKTRAANRGDFFGPMVKGPDGGVQMDSKAFYVRPR